MNKNTEKKVEQILASLENSKVENLELVKEVSQSFLDYSMSVITARSLPDVRDGLKPIHRRLLYGAYNDGLTSDKKYRKCATLVGSVMGSYHPHGDLSIYEALVRLAQEFSLRYPLIDGQGNFGSIDGDGPAAMRYTECKLSKIGDLFLQNINEETVSFVPNFDGSKIEPTVLPSPLPNILINGVQGIAVGMATSIPPHNLNEVCDAILNLIANENLTNEELSNFIKGPDFPTGGKIYGMDGINNYLQTGNGGFYNRARAEIVKNNENNNDLIIIKEIPYNIKKNNLLERIAKLAKPKKGDLVVKEIDGNIADIRDESSRGGIRVIIELKKGVNADLVLNALYRHSQMQVRFSANLTMLVNQTPKVLGVLEILKLYLKFQLEILVRKTTFNLKKVNHRIHILDGRLIVANDILKVVKIIAEEDDTETILRNQFSLSQIQIDDVLAQPLKSIRKIERQKLSDELENKHRERIELESILVSETKQKTIIGGRITEIKTKFGDKRRTELISDEEGKIDNEALIVREEIVITLSEKNYLKRTPLEAYKAHKRGGVGVIGAKIYDDDNLRVMLTCNSHDNLLFFSSIGKVYRMKAYHIKSGDRNTKGNPVNKIIAMNDNERILTILVENSAEINQSIFFATKKAFIKKTKMSEFVNINVNGKKAVLIKEGDELVSVLRIDETDEILLAGSNGKLVRFEAKNLRNMGRNTRGVFGMKLSKEDFLVSAASSNEGDYVFSISKKGMGKISKISDFRLTKRNSKGVISQKINDKTGAILMSMVVNGTEDILLMSNKSRINRFNIKDFIVKGRNSSGVILFRVDDSVNESISYAAKCAKTDNEEESNLKSNENQANEKPIKNDFEQN